jgi:hypothetical protein
MTAIVRPLTVVIGNQHCGPTCQFTHHASHYYCQDPEGLLGIFACECSEHPDNECAYYAEADKFILETDDEDEDATWLCIPCSNGDHTAHTMRDPIQTLRRTWNPK